MRVHPSFSAISLAFAGRICSTSPATRFSCMSFHTVGSVYVAKNGDPSGRMNGPSLPSQSSLPKKSGDSGSRSGSSFGLEAFTTNLTARGRETRVALDLARRAGTERAAIAAIVVTEFAIGI